METERVESNKLPDAPQVFQESPEEEPIVDASKNPGWRAIFREAFNKARREQKPTTTRRDLASAVACCFCSYSSGSSPRRISQLGPEILSDQEHRI